MKDILKKTLSIKSTREAFAIQTVTASVIYPALSPSSIIFKG